MPLTHLVDKTLGWRLLLMTSVERWRWKPSGQVFRMFPLSSYLPVMLHEENERLASPGFKVCNARNLHDRIGAKAKI
jgi:hypothetical protein